MNEGKVEIEGASLGETQVRSLSEHLFLLPTSISVLNSSSHLISSHPSTTFFYTLYPLFIFATPRICECSDGRKGSERRASENPSSPSILLGPALSSQVQNLLPQSCQHTLTVLCSRKVYQVSFFFLLLVENRSLSGERKLTWDFPDLVSSLLSFSPHQDPPTLPEYGKS